MIRTIKCLGGWTYDLKGRHVVARKSLSAQLNMDPSKCRDDVLIDPSKCRDDVVLTRQNDDSMNFQMGGFLHSRDFVILLYLSGYDLSVSLI